jgi:hypothetical protein
VPNATVTRRSCPTQTTSGGNRIARFVTFTLTADEFATVWQGDPIVVQYGSGQGAAA